MTAGAPALTGLYAAGALLLGAAGISKVRRPADSATALRAAGLPVTPGLVRGAAAIEVALAAAALGVPGPVPAILMALSYLGFAAFVGVAMRRDLPLASCGCFGRPDTPPSWGHFIVNLVAAASAAAWAVDAGASLPVTLSGQAWKALPLALGAVVVAGLAAAVLTNPLTQARHERSGERS